VLAVGALIALLAPGRRSASAPELSPAPVVLEAAA
jgi:hypothetical protein